jgi:phosphonopyruvate decarboxylase
MLTREQAIENLLDGGGLIISSTGKISRELFDLRKKRGEPTNDFYMMGSMGCAIGIGLGLALNTKKNVYVLTGDGALLMHLGSLATVAKYNLPNLKIIVLNNGCHDSTGGQPTNFEMVRDFVGKHCTIIDVEKGSRSDLGRPDITPEEMVANFMKRL